LPGNSHKVNEIQTYEMYWIELEIEIKIKLPHRFYIWKFISLLFPSNDVCHRTQRYPPN
jgi:hypothetical protein